MIENERKFNSPLPICIVSGFLGAGKTTLLNNIINADHGLRMGVLINDFGAIDIDSQLIAGVDEDTISLRSGCICCTMRDDFLDAIIKLVKRPDPPEYLLVETSGVSDPGSVVFTLTDPALMKALRVEMVITIVDAAELLALSKEQCNLAEAQIRTADLVVINKCDLVDEEQLESVDEKVRSLAPKARILHTQHGKVPLPLILGVEGERGRKQPSLFTKDWKIHEVSESAISGPLVSCRGTKHEHRHGGCAEHAHKRHGHDCRNHHNGHRGCHSLTDAFQSCSYLCDRPMTLDKLREVLMGLPLTIYRLKGFFHVDAAPEQRLLIQVVGSRISAVEVEPWGDKAPRTEVVAIGQRGTVDDRVLAALFDSCIAKGKVSLGKGLAGKVLFRRRKEKGQSSDEESRVS